MIFKLFVNYYCDSNENRSNEINKCFISNLKNDEIDHLYILISSNDLDSFDELIRLNTIDSTRYTLIPFEGRVTFNEYFNLTIENSNNDEITAISNSDIIFPSEDVKKIKDWHWNDNYCMALCRYDIVNESPLKYKFLNRIDSQDVWIVKGGFKQHELCNFTMGLLGCDNKIAYYLNKQYKIINPSLDIVTLHLHLTNIRNYDMSTRLNKPYHLLPPENLII